MRTATPATEEEIRTRHLAHDRQRVDRSRRKHEARLRNTDLLLRLEDGRRLVFRGRGYDVPPVPWPVAAQILETQARLDDLAAMESPTWAHWREVYSAVGWIFKDAARPSSGWRRWLWPLLPSPAALATPAEVGELLGFFSTSLAMDHAATTMTARPRHGMSRPTSQVSSPDTRPGVIDAAARFRGSTS
jgi:hypothetical protein